MPPSAWKASGIDMIMMIGGAVFLIAAVFVVSCNDGCEPNATRCNGSRVEICNTEADWELEADCSKIEDFGEGIDWTCCLDPLDGLHSCLPSDECELDEDGGAR